MKLNNTIQKLSKSNLPVIIFGAGVVGEVVQNICENYNIKVNFFCDNNCKKHGQKINNIEILNPEKAKQLYPDANWIITTADYHEICQQLKKLNYTSNRIINPIEILEKYKTEKYNKFNAYNLRDTDKGFLDFAVNCTINCVKGFYNQESINLRSIDIVVTEKCSMRCVDCSNLMQYFEKPNNYNLTEINDSVDLICEFVDGVHEFRIIGGEPLMNKEVFKIIKHASGKNKIEKIVIYTNGTIVPKSEQFEILRHNKVFFNITDYSGCDKNANDKLTKKLSNQKPRVDQLEELCIKNKINYRRHPPENWTDCGKILKYIDDVEKIEEKFNQCCCKNLITLSNGELHRCPFSAQITRLGVSDFMEDYLKLNTVGISNSKNVMKNFIYEKKSLKACGYCPGRPLSDPKITPGIQTKEVLKIPV